MAVERNRGLLLALAGIAVLLIANLIAYRATTSAGDTTPPLQFSAVRAHAQLTALLGNGVPHPVGSTANALVRQVILDRLVALGYSPELQSGFACNGQGECATVVNIIARLDAATPVEDAVMLAAHYDSVPAGPGASDDGVGVAVALEIARILKLSPVRPRHPILLLITDAEESGLLGASLFVSKHPFAGKIKAVVNMDARGTSGMSLMFETGAANAWIIPHYGSSAAHPVTNSIFYSIYKMLPNGTDFTVFKTAGYQGVNLAFVGGVSRYHTPQDNLANVSLNTMQHQGDNALASLEMLAADRLDATAGEAVFFDVFGRAVISWRASAALPAAIAAAVVLLAEAILLITKGTLNFRMVSWSLAAVSITLIGALAACGCFVFILNLVGRLPPLTGSSWIAHPVPMEIACVALAFVAAASSAALLAKRINAWSLWLAAALIMNALNVALSVFLPGTTFITMLTSAAAVSAALPACIDVLRGTPPRRGTGELSLALPALIFFATLIPSLLLLYSGLGALAWPIITLLVTLGAVLLLPQMTQATRRVRQRILVVSASLALIGLSVTVLLPTYTEQWPQRLNFEYWLDADAQAAHWVARPDSMHLPRMVREAAAFDPTPRPRYSGSASLGFMAPAAARPLPAPRLELLSATAVAPRAALFPTLTRFNIHVQSMRGAPSVFIVFPALTAVRQVIIATPDGDLRSGLRELASGATRLSIDALPASGVNFSVDAATDTLAASVYDVSYELPDGSILQRSRPENATSSQDGDVTIVAHTVSLDPAAGR